MTFEEAKKQLTDAIAQREIENRMRAENWSDTLRVNRRQASIDVLIDVTARLLATLGTVGTQGAKV